MCNSSAPPNGSLSAGKRTEIGVSLNSLIIASICSNKPKIVGFSVTVRAHPASHANLRSSWDAARRSARAPPRLPSRLRLRLEFGGRKILTVCRYRSALLEPPSQNPLVWISLQIYQDQDVDRSSPATDALHFVLVVYIHEKRVRLGRCTHFVVISEEDVM
jgi:hypothetical protein